MTAWLALEVRNANPACDLEQPAVRCGGVTPVLEALSHSQVESIKTLLVAGANPNTRSFDGHTALHIATRRYHCGGRSVSKNVFKRC